VCASNLFTKPTPLATLAEILGTKLPENAGEDSFSLMPLLKGEERPIRTHAISAACAGTPSLREGDWKLVFAATPELYNLDDDLGESMNIAPLHPERVKSMQSTMEKLIVNGRSTPGAPQKNDIRVTRHPRDEKARAAKR
jgi:arylsulfatase A